MRCPTSSADCAMATNRNASSIKCFGSVCRWPVPRFCNEDEVERVVVGKHKGKNLEKELTHRQGLRIGCLTCKY